MTVEVAPNLFSPVKVGEMTLKHRIVMGPMTRSRSPGEVANDLNVKYYSQRATEGGLIITEGTSPSRTAAGYDQVPGIRNPEEAAGWKKSVDAVHAKGGYIYAQLWHVGRASKKALQPDHKPPVAPSPLPIKGKEDEAPRELTVDEIQFIVQEFKESAKQSQAAGFDGVEIHGAHGYLIDQFLQISSNKRTDKYGGSIENRARFLFEVLDAILTELPSSKVAIRLSPWMDWQDCTDEDPEALFSYVLKKLAPYKLAYIHLTEPVWGGRQQGPPHSQSKLNVFRPLIQEPTKLLLTGGYLLDSAEEALATNRADIIGFAQAFITNPDLVERFRLGKPLTPYDNLKLPDYYGGGEKNYATWKTWREQEESGELSRL